MEQSMSRNVMRSAHTKATAYCKLPYNRRKIQELPDLQQGGRHGDIQHLQNYLKNYGYLTTEATSSKDLLDEPTCDAIKGFQRFFSIQETGDLDQATREKMAASRCGVPDTLDPLAFNTTAAGWTHRQLTYKFGNLSTRVPADVARSAVRRAFDVWKNAGVGLTFEDVSADDNAKPEIFVEWRPAADPDHSMIGGVLAHADFPPGFSVIARELPLPLHFDDEEHQWVDGAQFGGYDIETIAIHEIGHTLGMYHSNVNGSCMYPTVASNHTLRVLQRDDVKGIKKLYPLVTGRPSTGV